MDIVSPAESREYQKIPGPWRRHTEGPDRNKLIKFDWTSDELRYLQDATWEWTEKVDGTNIRVHWDGHKVSYGGRTANAQIPAKLITALDSLFFEEIFEQAFQSQPVTLYGEGYGAGIQKGGVYRPDQSFVLFDVLIADWWLRRDDMRDVAAKLGIDAVPLVGRFTLNDAIKYMGESASFSHWNPEHTVEGWVGVTPTGLLDRAGRRLIVKVKHADFGVKS